MRVEDNTIFVTRSDVDTFFNTLRQSMGAFVQQETCGPEPELPLWVCKVHKHLEKHIFLHIKEAATETGYRNSYKVGRRAAHWTRLNSP
jgi:hypothetical protein